ncbi:MAG TPA: glutaminyl-peptide cyclotransferase [Aldersonia sp.]
MRVCAVIIGAVGSLVVACGDAELAAAPVPAELLRVEVVATHPHDPTAFTEGFEIADGVLLEGTGLVGGSYLKASDLATGAELRRAPLDPVLFGEGITATDTSIWQLTYRDHVAIERDPQTLEQRRRIDYPEEGWGICALRDGSPNLLTSNGTDTLTVREPENLAPLWTVQVPMPVRLNELECAADGSVYANAWPTDTILRLDPDTGAVLAVVDASRLRSALPVGDDVDVLNGIAEVPGTDRFLLTGKYWPTTFEVRIVG